MPVPKVRTGRLAPDQEALDYYNVPVKHWTQTDWDQMDMDYLDVGLHTDPTPGGFQATDRRNAVSEGWFPGKKGGVGDDAMKDLRIHVGRELHVSRDPGQWDRPDDARMALSDAAYDSGEMELRAALDALEVGNGSTVVTSGTAREQVLAQMAAIRQTLKDHDYDTISYVNEEEGVDAAIDAVLNSPETLAADVAELEKARALRDQAIRAERDGDFELGEQLDQEATNIEDGIEMAREELREQAQQENISYISLNPGNVRSADAAFKKENIGKADMMGAATVPTLAGSAALGALGTLAQKEGVAGLGAGVLDSANRFGELLVNDFLKGSQGLSNALYDTRDTAPQVQFAPRTEAGDALSEGVMNDVVKGLQFKGFFGDDLGLPSGMDLIEGGMEAYKEYVKPHLSERAEQGLGGGALLASLFGLPAGSVGRDAKHLKRVGDAAQADALDMKLEGGALVAPEKVDPQALIGRPFVSNMADNSAGDRSVITQIDGVDIPGVIREGGFDYMRQPRNVEDGRLWSSEKGAVTGILNAAQEAEALPGAKGTAVMLPWGMSPAGSSDFAQFSADLGVQHGQQVLDPKTIKALDERIRTGTGTGTLGPVPEWVGLADATPEYLTALGGKRKNVLAALDEFRNEGTLNLSQIRQAVGDAEATLGYRPAGVLRVGEIDRGRGVMDQSFHQTYSKGVPGTYMGNLNPGASILDVPQLRSGINLRDKYGPIAGDKLPSAQGKAMQSNVIGVLDEDTIERWYRAGVFD
jgi:hypothetical protein